MPRMIDFGQERMTAAADSFHRKIAKDCNQSVVKDGEKVSKVIANIEDLAYALTHNGINPQDGTHMSPQDISAAIDFMAKDFGVGPSGILTQQVVTRGIEMLEPIESIYQMFSTPMQYKTGTQVIIPYVGETAGARDVGPSQEYPILSLDESAEVIANCGKSGIAVQLPEETMRNANYPIFNLYLSKARDSLARWKDNKAVRHVLTKSTVLFDNLEEAGAVYGKTTGRSIKTGNLNGTFTIRDLFKMYMYGVKNGYTMDTLIMSTWGYLLFMNDPTLRAFVEHNGGVIFAAPNGKVGKSRNEIAKQSRETGMGSFNKLSYDIPKALMNVGFKIIVTPYVPVYQKGDVVYKMLNYDYTSQKVPYLDGGGQPVKCGNDPMTDIVMLDSSNCLLYLEEEGVTSDTIENKMYEVTTVKMRERYKFAELEKGRAIVSARNLSITEDTLDVLSYMTVNLTEAQTTLAKS